MADSTITLEILWINETAEELKLKFMGWDIIVKAHSQTPGHVQVTLPQVGPFTYQMKLDLGGQTDEIILDWKVDAVINEVFVEENVAGRWFDLKEHSFKNRKYKLHLVNLDGLVIVGTIEIGVDLDEVARIEAAK